MDLWQFWLFKGKKRPDHTLAYFCARNGLLERITQVTFEFQEFKWEDSFRTTPLPRNVAPSRLRRHSMEYDLMWALITTYPALQTDTVRSLMEAPKMLMRESVFKLLSDTMPTDQSNVAKLVTKCTTGEYDASVQLA